MSFSSRIGNGKIAADSKSSSISKKISFPKLKHHKDKEEKLISVRSLTPSVLEQQLDLDEDRSNSLGIFANTLWKSINILCFRMFFGPSLDETVLLTLGNIQRFLKWCKFVN